MRCVRRLVPRPRAASRVVRSLGARFVPSLARRRREGLRFRKNEVYIDVNESVNLLMSANGTLAAGICPMPASPPSALASFFVRFLACNQMVFESCPSLPDMRCRAVAPRPSAQARAFGDLACYLSIRFTRFLTGNILRNECAGQVIMKTQLSGMPECKVRPPG